MADAGGGEEGKEADRPEVQRKISEPIQPASNQTSQAQGTDCSKKSSKKKGKVKPPKKKVELLICGNNRQRKSPPVPPAPSRNPGRSNWKMLNY